MTVDQRDGFTPSSEAIYTSKEETVPSRRRKGTDQVDMHMMKACVGGIKGSNRCFVVAVHLGGLAWGTAPFPLASMFLQAIPSETFHDEANGCSYAWMGETVKGVKDFSSESNRHNRPWNAGRLIADDLNVVIKG